jgi:hypothetical protein
MKLSVFVISAAHAICIDKKHMLDTGNYQTLADYDAAVAAGTVIAGSKQRCDYNCDPNAVDANAAATGASPNGACACPTGWAVDTGAVAEQVDTATRTLWSGYGTNITPEPTTSPNDVNKCDPTSSHVSVSCDITSGITISFRDELMYTKGTWADRKAGLTIGTCSDASNGAANSGAVTWSDNVDLNTDGNMWRQANIALGECGGTASANGDYIDYNFDVVLADYASGVITIEEGRTVKTRCRIFRYAYSTLSAAVQGHTLSQATVTSDTSNVVMPSYEMIVSDAAGNPSSEFSAGDDVVIAVQPTTGTTHAAGTSSFVHKCDISVADDNNPGTTFAGATMELVKNCVAKTSADATAIGVSMTSNAGTFGMTYRSFLFSNAPAAAQQTISCVSVACVGDSTLASADCVDQKAAFSC